MSFAFIKGTAHVTGGIVQNVDITNSSITMSENLDMGNNQIDNVADPTEPLDAVNLQYLQANAAVVSTITLTGTAWTTISSATFGSFIITVTPVVLSGPAYVFHIIKNLASKNYAYQDKRGMRGDTSFERLELRWESASGIQLRKTGSGYDGDYTVKIV